MDRQGFAGVHGQSHGQAIDHPVVSRRSPVPVPLPPDGGELDRRRGVAVGHLVIAGTVEGSSEVVADVLQRAPGGMLLTALADGAAPLLLDPARPLQTRWGG